MNHPATRTRRDGHLKATGGSAVVLVALAIVGEFPAAQASTLPREATVMPRFDPAALRQCDGSPATLEDPQADEPAVAGQRCTSIAVFAEPDIKDSLVNRVAAEAETIWKPTGIMFEWHRHTSDDPPSTRQIAVTIDDHREGATEWQAALGWIRFMADGPVASIHLSRADARGFELTSEELAASGLLQHGPN